MYDLSKLNNLLDHGFSLLTTGGGKIPNFPWTRGIPYEFFEGKQVSEEDWKKGKKIHLDSESVNKEQFEFMYNYKGGLHHWHKSPDKTNIPPTKGVGLITGYDSLEVIDVDLKVFSTAKEQKDFWELLISYLEDSILDFHEKFVIAKTRNNGFHILYKSKRVQGNRKIASLKGHTESVIETRGIGGYVFIYDNLLNGKYYTDIQSITDEDREILFDICDSFDYKEAVKIEPPKKEKKVYSEGITPWDDFNQKNSVWDIISDEFSIVRQQKDRMVVKRHGADSAHSGYIFLDNGCLYLHSSGTAYEPEKQISAFDAYVVKSHGGDYSEAAKKAYADGYGDRLKVKTPETNRIQEQKEALGRDMEFPLDIFPAPFQRYILDCHETLGASIDYMGCSLLWCMSLISGNSYKIETKRGWGLSGVLWIALVGDTGVGKTPSINNILRPLKKENGNEIRRYSKEVKKFQEYDALSAKEKKTAEAVNEPLKNQFIVGDATIESLVQLHQQNPNGVGVHKDELAGWIKDFNKYRDGSDKESFLSIWDGESVVVNRVRSESNAYLEQPYIPILGGIQPNILNSFYTDDNKDSGFIDRILLSYPDIEIPFYNRNEMELEVIQWYDNAITNLYRTVKKNIRLDEDDKIIPIVYRLTKEADDEWERIFNQIVTRERSDSENEYMKSMLPKQKKYIPRFALLVQLLRLASDLDPDDGKIHKEAMLSAEKLSNYFIHMSKKLRVGAAETKEIKDTSNKKDRYSAVKDLYIKNPDFNRKKVAIEFDVTRQTINRDITKIKAELKTKKK